MVALPWLIVSVVFFTNVSISHVNGCSISLKDIQATHPVMLASLPMDKSTSYKLFKPTGSVTYLPVGTKLRLLCAGPKNVIRILERQAIELICHPDNSWKTADRTAHTLAKLTCQSIPTADLRQSSERCGPLGDGQIFEAGFSISKDDFAKVFSICYDSKTENTLYTHNTLNGAAIKYAVTDKTRRPFRANGMKMSTVKVNKYYTIQNQMERFQDYFGDEQKYVNKQMFLSRGHLSPDADFIFVYEQLATYFYTNVAPEFQVINAGNWVRVENLARSLATEFGNDLKIYNGYMGQLHLPHPKTGDLIDIFLENGHKIEVPEYYFKVIKHDPTDAAIVMITVNNPYATDPKLKEFCTNVCIKAGLQNKHFTEAKQGYTFCCELNEFKLRYPHLPKELKASNLLKEPGTGNENKTGNLGKHKQGSRVVNRPRGN